MSPWPIRSLALVLLVAAGLLLSVSPLHSSRRRLRRLAHLVCRRQRIADPGVCAWGRALAAWSRRLPRPRCLARALACDAALHAWGHQPRLRLGVGRLDNDTLAAHAWVHCAGHDLGRGQLELIPLRRSGRP
ncbi:MAG: lasso peptide biosynthesis B2 protein [Planctomycetota bacterium]|jgi:hypothetical protein